LAAEPGRAGAKLLQFALRGHAALVERAPSLLVVLFARIADRGTEPSTPPALGKKKCNANNQAESIDIATLTPYLEFLNNLLPA
jgi:hypothetical protein